MSETNKARKAPADRAETSHTVVVPSSINMVALLGAGDEHLGLIEQALEADVHVRGNEITLRGEPGEVALAERMLDELVTIIRTGQGISPETVERVIGMLRAETTELKVLVVPEFDAGGAALAYAAVNPAVGLTTFLAQLLLKKPIAAANTTQLRVSGPWADPKVEKIEKSSGSSNAVAPSTTAVLP